MKIIITTLCGGLGNQMFQYAAGRALALRTGVPLQLDTSWYANIVGNTPREYILHMFPINGKIAAEEQVAQFRRQPEKFHQKVLRKLLGRPRSSPKGLVEEPHFHYWPGIMQVQAPAYLAGYWQSELYFAEYASAIRADFQFPPLPEGTAQTVAQAIASSPQPIAVHVRRGDYVASPEANANHGVCSANYYAEAIAQVAAKCLNASLFLFSDDPAWVQENFATQGLPATVVDLALPEEPWHDMHLISLCRHHVIANSSFSWWGAWLGEKGGMVCAPKQWFAAAEKQGLSPCPNRWTIL